MKFDLYFIIQYSRYLTSLKKIVIILTLVLFSLSTLIMPYANFDDTHSLQAVYNNCLKLDTDMDFLEFLTEKLLVGGFDPGEAKEKQNPHPQHPVTGATIVQIQSGGFCQQHLQEMNLEQPETITLFIPLSNTTILSHDFHPGIFHPPSFA